MIDNKTIRQVVINKALLPCTPDAEVTREASGSGSSDRAVFSCNLIKPLESLIFTLEPQQEGSGDPSPDNPRPISGESEIKFFTRYGDPSSYTIPLTVTVYGGYVNEKGEVWATHGLVDMGSLSWTYTNSIFRGLLTDGVILSQANIIDFLCEIYLVKGSGNSTKWTSDNLVCWHGTGSNCYVYVNDTNYNDADAFKTAVTGHKLVYELATPVKVATIDPIVINTNKGTNEMWTRGDIPFTLEYKYMEGGSCELSKQFLPIFYPNGKGVKHHGSTF